MARRNSGGRASAPRVGALTGARVALAAGSLLAAACASTAPKQAEVDTPVIEVGKPAAAPLASEVTAEPGPPAAKTLDSACIADLLAGGPLRSTAGGADQLLYDEGYRAMIDRDLTRARKKLLELVDRHKKSPFVPSAYLLFAEMFAAEAEKDPSKAPIAANFYVEALKFPPSENPAFHFISLRAGDIRSAQGMHPRALLDYKRALEGRSAHPAAPCIEGIAAKATEGLVASYAKVGAPNKAFAFFRQLSGDQSGRNERTFAMMTMLAAELAPSDVAAAAAVVEDVLRRGATGRACRELQQLALQHAQLDAKVGHTIRSSCR